ncbi:MAG TPA: hypothetical protein VFB82_13055 [Blastocatellia bacterium]|nr:hypothetical protein [Blastocatellia bacterium]
MKSEERAPNEKIFLERERRIRLLIVLLCLTLAALSVVPFYFLGPAPQEGQWTLRMPTTHDMYLQFDQMKSFYNGLSAGSPYPRWEEDTNRGFGAPTTSYYPPGVYYVTSGLYAVVGDWTRVLLDAQLIMMVAAGAALYLVARRFMSRAGAIVSMAAYIASPYHVIDQYQRGALAELLSFVWMPLILLFTERLFANRDELADFANNSENDESVSGTGPRTGKLLDMACLAAAYGAFLWSHPPTAYQFTLIFTLLVVIVAWRLKDWKGLLGVGCAMVIGGGLSAAYLYPAVVEGGLIRPAYFSEKWAYHLGYVFVHAQPYADAFRDFFKTIDWIWMLSTAVIVIGGVALIRWAEPNQVGRSRIALLLAGGLLASFMMTKASSFLGDMIPRVEVGIFPWRMLGITSLVASLLAGASTEAALAAFKARRTAGWIALGSFAALVTVGGALFSVFQVAAPMADVEAFEPQPEHINFAMVPVTAPEDPLTLPEIERARLASGNGRVLIADWKPDHRHLQVELPGPDQLQIRTFNFPGWTATLDDRPCEILTNASLGNIEIDLPAGIHRVELDFRDTTPRRIGKIASILSLVMVLALVAFGVRRSKSAWQPRL